MVRPASYMSPQFFCGECGDALKIQTRADYSTSVVYYIEPCKKCHRLVAEAAIKENWDHD